MDQTHNQTQALSPLREEPQNPAGDTTAASISIDPNPNVNPVQLLQTIPHEHSTSDEDEDDTDTTPNDETFSDADSAFSEDTNSLASLESWVVRYRMENGRRFHSFKDGAYLLPNDEPELDRLDMHHHIFTLALDERLFLAPLQSGAVRKILDVGTGTGIWALDVADTFPDAQVIGVDLSPVQPPFVPPNVEFQIDDVEDDWTYNQRSTAATTTGQGFDFIHIRSMAGSIGNWHRLLQQAYRHLNPGGYIEVQEFEVWIRSDDGSIERAPYIRQWQEGLNQAAEKIGKPMLVAPHLKRWLGESGFEGLEEKVVKVRCCNPFFLLLLFSERPHDKQMRTGTSRPLGPQAEAQAARPLPPRADEDGGGLVRPGALYAGAGLEAGGV